MSHDRVPHDRVHAEHEGLDQQEAADAAQRRGRAVLREAHHEVDGVVDDVGDRFYLALLLQRIVEHPLLLRSHAHEVRRAELAAVRNLVLVLAVVRLSRLLPAVRERPLLPA